MTSRNLWLTNIINRKKVFSKIFEVTLDKQFDLFLPEKVFQEYLGKLSKGQLEGYDDVRPFIDLYFKRKRTEGKLIEEKTYTECLKYVKRFFFLIGKQKKYRALGEGEIHCIALGLYLSRKIKRGVFVLSDDFGAIDAGIDTFVYKTCFGSVRSLLEAMVFLYCISRDIPVLRMYNLVKDYFVLNEPKSLHMQDFQKEIIEDITRSCRRRQKNWQCSLPCLAWQLTVNMFSLNQKQFSGLDVVVRKNLGSCTVLDGSWQAFGNVKDH